MSSLVALLLGPMSSSSQWDDDEERSNPLVFWSLSFFFAWGIYLVFDRYQKLHTSAIKFKFQVPTAADPNWSSLYIPNAHLESHLEDRSLLPGRDMPGRRYITAFDPSTGLHIGTFLADAEQEIEEKIKWATRAQREWKQTTFTQRRRVMRSLLKWLVDNQETCANVACRDTGKTQVDAALGEILTTCSKLEWLMHHGEEYLRPERRKNNLALTYKIAEVHYEPLGVVAGIVSWNYPLHNAWSPIIAAIFSGNGIVLKCSEKVIWSSTYFVNIIQTCLEACGHDPNLVQLTYCYPDEVETLTTSPLIKHITFIGSEPVGRKVAIAATKHLTPVTLELGGKDPAIILPQTDLEKWASVWMRGVYQNAGQNCIGIERIIVHSTLYDRLEEIFKERVEKLRVGSVMAPSPDGPVQVVDTGSMIDSTRFRGMEKLLRDAEEEGANIIGGKEYESPWLEHGQYFGTTVVCNAEPSMQVAKEEMFAPVVCLISYDEVEDAIDIANGTRYGLGASVFGPDQTQCLAVAKELDCGMVAVNDFGVFYLNQDLPFGGTKASGYGRFGGPEGLRALTNVKAVMVDRWPNFIQTAIPRVLDYPIRSLTTSWNFTSGMVRVLYGDAWRDRFQGLVTLVRAMRADD
ncbi:Aldehyde/histidinol dehydrogenase [Pterulicium gracile]|uniref:Aldehyde/histidinol dehydrogenase n=1 Tax=Pterulicium gracile TaxID=1884261 RepID=A0A5C3R261_9AGAR|nr:Aldehyde/histidinol dehydrogenase [Pterula gracilis]